MTFGYFHCKAEENRTKRNSQLLIPRLLFVWTQKLEILVTPLYFYLFIYFFDNLVFIDNNSVPVHVVFFNFELVVNGKAINCREICILKNKFTFSFLIMDRKAVMYNDYDLIQYCYLFLEMSVWKWGENWITYKRFYLYKAVL